MSTQESIEYYRFTINETINRCEDEKALPFVYHALKGIKPELRERTQAEREALAQLYDVTADEVSKTGSLI